MTYDEPTDLITLTTLVLTVLHIVMVKFYAQQDEVRDVQTELVISGALCAIQLYVGIILLLNEI